MEALNYLQAASAKVQPFVPVMQATSSTGTTVSLLWNALPKAVKIMLGVVILVGLGMLIYKVVTEVKRMKKAFKVDDTLKKKSIDTGFVPQFCDWLIEQSKAASSASKAAYEAHLKDEGMAHAAQAAAYMQMAVWLMPKRTQERVPDAKRMVHLIDDALKQRLGRGLEPLVPVKYADK